MIAIRVDEHGEASVDASAEWAAPRQAVLRRVLVASDAVAVAGAWTVVLGPLGGYRSGSPAGLLAAVAAVTAGALALMASHKLYLARVCRVRAVELSRILRVSVVTAVAAAAAGARWGVELTALGTAVAVAATVLALATTRGCYSLWLRRRRSRGRSTRPVVVVGDAEEAGNLATLLRGHPELGFEVAARLAPDEDILAALRAHRSDSVVLATSAFDRAELNRVTRRLLEAQVHIHLSTGLSGFDFRRLRAQPLAREPLFYLEPLSVTPWQQVVKRAVDVVGSGVGLVLSLPVLLAAAVAVKVEDGGPVLFRHRRVGQDGAEFTLFKLRTMVPDAERQLHRVAAANQRTGPLFKSHHDPRITKVGRVLRAMSIDELPQLVNVLFGTMSLVGPRPALAYEVAQFDAELRARERVRPGITGLWQIEGRDDPSFDAYRRLDLFYVENWSLELDLVILLTTARAVFSQALRDIRREWRPALGVTAPLPVIDLTAPAAEGAPQ